MRGLQFVALVGYVKVLQRVEPGSPCETQLPYCVNREACDGRGGTRTPGLTDVNRAL